MTKPLEGLLVVSLEQAVAAPYCSSRLADAGARVIKIERAEGDFARAYDSAVQGMSSYFVWLNRGKESFVADIKQPERRRTPAPSAVASRRVHPEPGSRRGSSIRIRIGSFAGTARPADHRRHLRLWRDRRVCDDEGLRPVGAGGGRPRDGHWASRRSRPRWSIDRRCRLWDECLYRCIGGIDRAPADRSWQRVAGQSVRCRCRLDECPRCCTSRAPAKHRNDWAWPIHLSARMARSRRTMARWS